MISAAAPFVLLDDARSTGAAPARLYRDPVKQLTAHTLADVGAVLNAARDAVHKGLHVAGYLAYEAGLAFEPSLAIQPAKGDCPLAWFGVFDGYQEIDAAAVPEFLPDPNGAWLSPITPDISRSQYAVAFDTVQKYITAGDIYQANLTIRAFANYSGSPLALYAAIRPQAAAGYGGIVWTGKHWHLSFSPELFFALKDRRVTTKPMKGTAERDADPALDASAANALQQDPKQRAENLMIVDLLRNDLSRVCEIGSVEVPDLFRIESYPTVHQMTSTVTGQLAAGKDAVDLIEAIFPCGSITGAPKIRAMQIIGELETRNRAIYCGSIGRIDADGTAAFNVAIRTLSINEDTKQASLGLGSGLVADSIMSDEWQECRAKGEFARMDGGQLNLGKRTRYPFDLIETMRFEPATGLQRLELHLDRMKQSARQLGFEFDRHAARNQLHAAIFHLQNTSKVRLLSAKSGSISIEVRSAPADIATPWRVGVVPQPVATDDFRLIHKTSDRGFYDAARHQQTGADEVLFTDPEGFLTEGSFTALFVEHDGKLLTPKLSRGLLPSVLRAELLGSGQAAEADLRIDDLSGGFLLGNSLRGLIRAQIATKPVAK
jgi:para-aminobenzoate synthetase / 4-amino-4-deoxychorismate lyase